MKNHFLTTSIALALALSTARADAPHSPDASSPERKAILDALGHGKGQTFKVDYLKVHNGWAWADVTPLDKHGKPTAEGGPQLLHSTGGKWELLDLSKVSDDPKDPLGAEDSSPGFVKNAQRAFPGLPADIFPKPKK